MSDVIDQITTGLSRPYFRNILKKLHEKNRENADIICRHILAEQAEINIKNSTKEGKIKILTWLSNFFDDRIRYPEMTKQDILSYLNSLRKPSEKGNGWINSYSNRQMVFLKFFKWLYNQDEPDITKRTTPPLYSPIHNIRKKSRIETHVHSTHLDCLQYVLKIPFLREWNRIACLI
jgi:hypothetical protein